MPRFRVIYEVEAKDAAEARIAVQIGVERYMLDPDKFQKVRGKRKPKPNPNQMTIDNYIDKRYTDDNADK